VYPAIVSDSDLWVEVMLDELPRSISWSGENLKLLDQRLLPEKEEYWLCERSDQVEDAIRQLVVRGAPAIGIAAAYGSLLGLNSSGSLDAMKCQFREQADQLEAARPTAVNLSWALARMCAVADGFDGSCPELLQRLTSEAQQIHEEDKQLCLQIGRHALPIVRQYPNVLTHCNAGSLAVSELGTALAPIYLAHESGVPLHVWVDETRPLFQGARLTAFELGRAGVPHTVITDSMAASVMAAGKVGMVIVGADRVAANGDVANKIGTLGLAVLAQHFDIPFYVACPGSTVDLSTSEGNQIQIEERAREEITGSDAGQLVPITSPVFNPAFDVTPAALITAIVTEQGVLKPPFNLSLEKAHG